MARQWEQRLYDKWHDPIAAGLKMCEGRILYERNQWLIEEMRQYEPGDLLMNQFQSAKPILCVITAKTFVQALKLLSPGIRQKLAGQADPVPVEDIIDVYNEIYERLLGRPVTGETEIVVASFRRFNPSATPPP